jgi:hypothetical protein
MARCQRGIVDEPPGGALRVRVHAGGDPLSFAMRCVSTLPAR